MKTHNNDGMPDSDETGQAGVLSQSKDHHLAMRGNDSQLRESTDIDNGKTSLNCGKCVAAREEAAGLREGTVHLREKAATSREQDIRETESAQIASDERRLMLQQVNERLVIATIEAQKLAEQLQTTKDQMEIAKAAAEKANLAKSEFLSSMSHELRTPLNAILGFAQLLEVGTPRPTPAQKLRVDEIIKAGWYLLELINEILDLALIESGKVTLLIESVSLMDVMLECMAMIEPQAQQHGIKIILHPIDNTWLAKADRTRVKQVLLNLLSNAIKYNSKQGTIEVACTLNTTARIRISIKDSGAGLSPEQLAQLFQSFNRLGQEAGLEQGTGIGLVVSKHLVELMGGSIGVESTVGVGSEFWIELMSDGALHNVDNATANVTPIPVARNNPALSTVLYVEDNLVNIMLVEHIISDLPHLRLLSASDGVQGIALARSQLPAIILLDITLPDMSGIDVLKMLQLDPSTAHIPLIALSGNALASNIQQGLEAGFFRYLTKPIKVKELINALNDALTLSKTPDIQSNKGQQA